MTQQQFDAFLKRWTEPTSERDWVNQFNQEIASKVADWALESPHFPQLVAECVKRHGFKEDNLQTLMSLMICMLSMGYQLHSIEMAEEVSNVQP